MLRLFSENSLEHHYNFRLNAGSVWSARLVMEPSDIHGGQAQKILKIFNDLNFLTVTNKYAMPRQWQKHIRIRRLRFN